MKSVNYFLLCSLFYTGAFAQTNTIDSLQRIVDAHRGDTTETNALLDLAFEFSRKDSQKAKNYCYQSIELARSLNMPSGMSSSYGYLVTLHQNSGGLDSAGYYLALLEKISKENPNRVRIALNYNQTAGLFYKNQGQYVKALPYMLETLKLNKSENENYAGQLLNVGNTYHSLGDFKTAVNYHLQALSLFEKVNSKRGQSFCLQSLGNDLYKLNQFEQALGYFQRSIKLKEELNDKRGIINGWLGLGDIYREQNRHLFSEMFYLQALQSAREMKLILEEARCNNQLGLLYKKMGDVANANGHFQRAFELAKQAEDNTMAATINSELMALAVQAKQEKKVESGLFSNLNTFINMGDRSGEALEYFRLSEYYAVNKQYDKALHYLKKHYQLKDSLEGSSVLIQIKQLEKLYENDKKEKEIALLKKDQDLQSLALSQERTNNSLIIVALISVVVISVLLLNRNRVVNRNKRMLEVEKMRNNIARDLHDDIGSTLSSINIMSQIALQENGNDGTHLKKIATHSARMMENMSDIVWSINPRNDTLEQVAAKMKEFAAEILEPKEITYTFSIDESIAGLKMDVEKRKNIFLIFKEAVNNAAKYSEAGKLAIQLSRVNGSLILSVIDNGKGFDSATVIHGNGLNNMTERAHSMNGRLTQFSEPGKGSSVSLQVPLT